MYFNKSLEQTNGLKLVPRLNTTELLYSISHGGECNTSVFAGFSSPERY